MRARLGRLAALLILVSSLFVLHESTALAGTPPSGFTDTRIAAGLAGTTAMQFAPDGRLFISIQSGKIRIVKNGALLTTPFLSLTVASEGTEGLMGVTFDPAFAQNHYVYVFYTATSPTIHNRLSRFTANGDVAVAGSELVLLDLPTRQTKPISHDGGDVHFGPDGKLYLSVGDNLQAANGQSMTTLFGKLLRLNSDGTIPTDNPFYTTATGQFRAIWALGLRNPFKFDFQPGTGRMFINDVGDASWEEINEGFAGANYGWPTTEGPTTDSRFRSPVYAYPHSGGAVTGCATTGGAFYNPPVTTFPASYVGDFFFQDYCGGWIKTLDLGSGTVSPFATGITASTDLKTGPDGALYYLTRTELYKVQFSGSQAPSITSQPADRTVNVGQAATFSVTAAGTAPLSYQWQRNGVDIPGATSSSYTLGSPSLSDDGARFRCRVTNASGTATSSEAILTVVSPSDPPIPSITNPPSGTTYRAGDTISYGGTATDPEDGDLAASAFTWQIDFHHDTHAHPFIPATSGTKSGAFTVPVEGETSSNVWYRIRLTVRDSGGQTATTFRDVHPVTSVVQLATSPAGLPVLLDGQPTPTPSSFTGVEGINRSLEAPSPQIHNGRRYVFDAWSDGGARVHTIATPATDTTFTASYHDDGPAATNALLVVGSPTLSAGDSVVSSRLQSLGFAVTVVDDSVATAAEATGQNLVLISATAKPELVAAKFRTVAVPVMLWQAWLFDDMSMTNGSTTGRGTIGSQTKVAITDPGHPLAASLSGTQTVLSSTDWFQWGNPNSNAARVATVVNDPAKAVIFGYDAGANMYANLAAPARRVGFFLSDRDPTILTANGQALFDAAVTWASGGVAPTDNEPPIAHAGLDQTVAPGATVTLDGTESTDLDSGPQPLTYSWIQLSGPPVPISNATSALASFQAVDAGQYVFRLQVSDGQATSTDDTTVDVQVAGAARALLVVGSPTLSAGDSVVSSRLQSLGFAVTVVDDSVATAAEATGQNLVLISATAKPELVAAKFRTVAVPVMLWQAWLFDDMSMTNGSTTGRGTIGSQTKVAITDPGHPLAASLSGTQTVLSSTDWFQWGNPNSNAARVATVVNDPAKAVIFGYDAGANMYANLAAPARRVGFFLSDRDPTILTANGQALFDAAVTWAWGG